ncbi:hypothetical protein [Nocardioides sp.]|uniref:hypothetical protein n=1 Tax=Nocardioides sp. TaxID=35761 RepID=UPI002B270896|nr:hypothetical protein [Nocardioides sp.]
MIVVSSAAPAFAVSDSTTPAAIVTTIGPLIAREGNNVIVPVTFINSGGPTTALSVEVQITATVGGLNSTQPPVRSGGWVRSREAETTATITMDVQFAKSDPQIGNGEGAPVSSLLEFSFNGFFQNGFLNGNISVVPTVTGTNGGAASPATMNFEVSAYIPQDPEPPTGLSPEATQE